FLEPSRDHRALHSFPTRRSSDLANARGRVRPGAAPRTHEIPHANPAPRGSAPTPPTAGRDRRASVPPPHPSPVEPLPHQGPLPLDRKSTRLNSSHGSISYAVFCL